MLTAFGENGPFKKKQHNIALSLIGTALSTYYTIVKASLLLNNTKTGADMSKK